MDVDNLKKWLKDLGFETNGKIDDRAINKLIPPQSRDMWRHVTKHVLPNEKADLIKKSVLLHKLQKRQKPLAARVESVDDLTNALKYEELLANYNRIQKEIADTRTNNDKMKSDLNEKYEYKAKSIANITSDQNKSYIAEHRIETYNRHIETTNELSECCEHFLTGTNKALTTTDYEDSLIECFIQVDNAKQSDAMPNDSVNVGKPLCNAIFKIIRDKPPAELIRAFEQNVTNYADESNEAVTGAGNTATNQHEKSNRDVVFNELSAKLSQKQLELHSKLRSSLAQKERVAEYLIDTVNLVKNEITSQYKLKNVSCTDGDLRDFEIDLKKTLQIVIENSLDRSVVAAELQEKFDIGDTLLDLSETFEKTNYLNEAITKIIGKSKTNICEMLTDLNDKKSDSIGLTELNADLNKLHEDYMEKIGSSHQMNKTPSSINSSASCDVDNITNTPMTTEFVTDSSPVNYRTLEDIALRCEMVNVISEITNNFKQFNNTLGSTCRSINNEVAQRENTHKAQFDGTISQIESNISILNRSVEVCKLIADVVLTGHLKSVVPKNN